MGLLIQIFSHDNLLKLLASGVLLQFGQFFILQYQKYNGKVRWKSYLWTRNLSKKVIKNKIIQQIKIKMILIMFKHVIKHWLLKD